MRLTGKLSNIYIPKFMKNRDLPKSEQVTVEMKYPTHEQRELLRSEVSYIQGKSGTEIKVKTNHTDVIRSCVGKITNLETDTDGPITRGEDLLAAKDPRLEGLIDELVAEAKSQTILTEESEKNSE